MCTSNFSRVVSSLRSHVLPRAMIFSTILTRASVLLTATYHSASSPLQGRFLKCSRKTAMDIRLDLFEPRARSFAALSPKSLSFSSNQGWVVATRQRSKGLLKNYAPSGTWLCGLPSSGRHPDRRPTTCRFISVKEVSLDVSFSFMVSLRSRC